MTVRPPAVLLGTLLMLGSGTSLAQAPAADPPPAPPAEVVDERVRQAAEAYDRGEFNRALELLQAAHAESPKPALLYNMAQVQRSKGDCAAARAAYRRFIDATPADDPNRARAERYESEMAACAERAAGPTPATALPPVSEPAPPIPPMTPQPDPAPAALMSHTLPDAPDEPEPTWSPRRFAAYALLGASVIAAGAGVWMGVKARKTTEEIVEKDKQDARHERFKSQRLWSGILAGASLASAGAAVTLLVF